jgi:glutamate--cysteine ligase
MVAEHSDLVTGSARLPGPLLRAGRFGLEREALRVTPSGDLALTPHPAEFGDKLGHPRITVDFSESQLELITAPHPSVETAWAELAALHDEVEAVLDARGERLWPFSMPPALPDENRIPIAQFGASAAAREHELYRIGLAHRYGRRRQMISGIHFSFSFGPALLAAVEPGASPDAAYFRTARNFLRQRWLLVYLTGASPLADVSFHREVAAHVSRVRACCPACCRQLDRYEQHAISLRTSRHGYADTALGTMPVSFDDRSSYLRDLRRLLGTRSDRFARLGRSTGAPRQLNDRVLQRESEFYAAIRLKGRLTAGSSHLDAIERGGVHYAEVRVLDIDPFVREGIALPTLHFLQVFLLDSLLGSPAPLAATEWEVANENQHRIALCGRDPDLRLRGPRGEVPPANLARPIFARLASLAAQLDEGLATRPYVTAVQAFQARFDDPAELPAARIAAAVRRRRLTHAGYGAHLLAPAAATDRLVPLTA